MNRRSAQLAGVALVVTMSIMGGVGAEASAGGAVAAAARTTTEVARCTVDDVAVSYRDRGGAAGSVYGVIRLTNTSGQACSTGGYGGVSYVGGGDGTQVGAAARRERRSAVRLLVLQPGDRARSRVRAVSAGAYGGRCHRRDVDGFRVYVPNETRSAFVVHPTTGCANPRVHLLSQRPYH